MKKHLFLSGDIIWEIIHVCRTYLLIKQAVRCLLLAALTAANKNASQPLESSSHNVFTVTFDPF